MADRSTIAVAAAMGSAALMPLNSTMIAVAIPAISADLGVSAAAATPALVGTYLVAAIVLQSPGGKIGDRLGHWRLLGIGQLAVAAGAGAAAVGNSLAVLGGARVLTAVGGAALVPAAVALMRLELPAERRSGAFGRFGAIMALAAAAGPLVGGELATLFGWRSLFLVNFPLLAIAATTILICRPRQSAPPHVITARFDWPGSVLLGAALTCLVTGLRVEGPTSMALLAGAVGLAVLFWWIERRAADPVIDFGLFRRRAFSAGTSVIALQNLAMYALLFQLPIIFHAALGLESNASGRLLIAMMLAMVVFSLASGRLSARLGIRTVALIGTALSICGLIPLWSIGPATEPLQAAASLALCGAGLGLCSAPAQAAAQSAAPGAQAGMAAGVSSTLRYLGGVVGIALLGLILHDDAPVAQLLSEHRTLIGVYCGTLALSGLAALALPQQIRR